MVFIRNTPNKQEPSNHNINENTKEKMEKETYLQVE